MIAATISAAIAAFGFVNPVSAQKDAAEKAKEGSVDHWIEYYKAERQKPATVPVPTDSAASPADRSTPGTPQQQKPK